MSYDALFRRCLDHGANCIGYSSRDLDKSMKWFSHASKLHHLYWTKAWPTGDKK